MIRIQTLGGLAVFDGTRPLGGNAQQPRRLAVLAVLARAGDRGVSRDRLAALLWEETEEERARRSLNQALYALRQELGSEEAILGTRELRLNPELIEVDLAAFETARASGALEQAARLYAGPFLGDFHLPGAPMFARWAEQEREGIAADYHGLLEAAAAAATARGDRAGAILWWRRLAALDPTDTGAAQGLMRALAVAGDAPGALRHAEIVQQLLREDLDLPPDAEVEALAERIRRGEMRAEKAEQAEKAEKAGTEKAEKTEKTEKTERTEKAERAERDSAPRPPPRRFGALAAGIGVLAILAGLLVWRSSRGGDADGPPRLAVLPFQNLGDSADAYFADGMTDELRGRLTAIPGLQVVASVSSNGYRGTTEQLPQIARDLGVTYLLLGKVRWQKRGGGASRVRVSPELIRIGRKAAPTTQWEQPFEAALTDVFQVQGDIATQVAAALNLVLGDSTRRELSLKPTENLAAYDEFLKGEAAAQGMRTDQAGLRRAIAFYQRAVSLDSSFAQAWVQLSRARTSLYSNGVPDQALARAALDAAERARALRPDDPMVYLATGDFYSSVNPIDNDRAAEEYEKGLRLAPNDVELLSAAATTGSRLEQWEVNLRRLQRAMRLDPRSLSVARRLAAIHIFLRQYDGADSAVDRAIALAPTSPHMMLLKVLVRLGRGDLAGARAVVRAAGRQIDPATVLAFVATYEDLYWVLDDSQQRQLLELPPADFDDDRAVWGLVRAEVYSLRGEHRRAAVYADSARLAVDAQIRSAPDDAQRRVLRGLTLAYLGRKAEAVQEGLRGVELLPISRDGFFGPYVQLQLVRIYLLVGEPEKAMDQLEPLLQVPFFISPAWLRIDPTFDPLRNEPRFKKMAQGAETAATAATN
jgi:DNA-binding SARP family transcriptional activator/TolB-like protein